jgi:hypothetical protein
VLKSSEFIASQEDAPNAPDAPEPESPSNPPEDFEVADDGGEDEVEVEGEVEVEVEVEDREGGSGPLVTSVPTGSGNTMAESSLDVSVEVAISLRSVGLGFLHSPAHSVCIRHRICGRLSPPKCNKNTPIDSTDRTFERLAVAETCYLPIFQRITSVCQDFRTSPIELGRAVSRRPFRGVFAVTLLAASAELLKVRMYAQLRYRKKEPYPHPPERIRYPVGSSVLKLQLVGPCSG